MTSLTTKFRAKGHKFGFESIIVEAQIQSHAFLVADTVKKDQCGRLPTTLDYLGYLF